jgi:hypothetical protein
MVTNTKTYFATEVSQLKRDIISRKPELFLGLSFNYQIHPDSAERIVRRFHAALDRKLFGKRRYWKLPADRRTRVFLFIEHIGSNLHYHGLVIPQPGTKEKIEQTSESIWKKIVKPGTSEISFITDWDREERVSYAMKEAWKEENYSQYLIL